MSRSAATLAVCVALILGSAYTVLRPSAGHRTVDLTEYRCPWVCDACGHSFLALPGPGTRKCPKCGADKGAQSIRCVCGKCGAEFEACRRVDHYDTSGELGPDGKMTLPLPHYKKSGGEWTTDRAKLGGTPCPKCGNADTKTLEEKRFGPPSK